jgi:hypothetical protein
LITGKVEPAAALLEATSLENASTDQRLQHARLLGVAMVRLGRMDDAIEALAETYNVSQEHALLMTPYRG